MIYQHEARGAHKAITDAIDKHVDDEQRQEDDGDDGPPGCPGPPNGTLMARRPERATKRQTASVRNQVPTWAFTLERMTGIEPALSAWESTDSVRIIQIEQHFTPTLWSRDRPLITAPNGPLMARHRRPKSGCNTLGRDTPPHRVTAALCVGPRGQRVRESGDTGDTRPRSVSPLLWHVSPA
jgi:hypothetical protein